MHRNFFVSLLCLFLGTHSVSANAFDDANRQFKAGDFAGAAAAHEKILTDSGPRASVFYNLGNSYQSLKQYGPAILAYERARLITPRDPDLLANLALARKAAAAFEDTRLNPHLEAVTNFLSRNEWSWLVTSSALFLGSLALLSGAMKLPQRIRLLAVVSSAVAALAIAAGATALYLRRDEARRGIILTESATVRLSPFDKAESLGTPGQGRMVQIGVQNGDFRYIEVPGSNLRGWLANKDVGMIMLCPEHYCSQQ